MLCFRGHGLTEKRELDAALSDLNDSIRLDPSSACWRRPTHEAGATAA